MNFKLHTLTLGAGLAAGLCASAATPLRAQTTTSSATFDHPNVVILYTDDLGYGDVSCYGATKVHTPNVDKLAENGIRFTNAHCAAATCTPSRFSILTGQYAWRKDGTGILPGNAGLIIPTDRATLGKVFQKAGYKTAAIGKWHLGLGSNGVVPDWNAEVKPGPNEVGFDYSFIFPATADRVPTVYMRNHKVVGLDPDDPMQVDYKKKIGDDPTGKENPERLKMKATHGHDNTIVNGIGRIGWMTGGNRARWVDEALSGDFTNEAEMFIERNRDNPFFLYFAIHDIHVPRMPDTRFKGKSGLGYRGDAILEMDHTVGRIMKKLDELHLTNNTIVIFSSDNGPVLDDGYKDGAVTQRHGHNPNGPMRGGKYSILEAGTRVPFIVQWPAKVKPAVSDALISQVDLVASFAAMMNQDLKKPDAPDSENTLDAFLGKSQKGREALVEQGRTLALIRGNYKYIAPHKGSALMRSVHIETGLMAKPQLYDLKNDLGETHNLADEKPDLVEDMANQLKQIKAQSTK